MEPTLSAEGLYAELPEKVAEDCPTVTGQGKGKVKLKRFLNKHVPKNRLRGGLLDDLKHKVHFLDNATKRRKTYQVDRMHQKTLSARERRELNLFKLSSDEQNYDCYLPLHGLWKDYMRDLLNLDKVTPQSQHNTEEKVLKSDLHGAMVTVTRSKCPSLVGITGIIIMETKNTFKLVTKANKVKVMPKQNTVFTMRLDAYMFTLYANQFMIKANDRAARKFKFKPTVDL